MKKSAFLLIFTVLLVLLSSCHVSASLTDDLTSYWKFDDATTSGSTTIDSMNKYNGTINGVTTGYAGKIGEAYDFDGGNDWLEFSTALEIEGGYLTVNFWVIFDDFSEITPLFGKDLYGGERGYYMRHRAPADSGVTHFYADPLTLEQAVVLTTGTWTMMTFVSNSTHWMFYTNGTIDGSPSAKAFGSSSSNNAFKIGLYGGEYANMKMDEFGWWNRSLSASEITELWNDGDGFSYPFSAPSTAPTVTAHTTSPATVYTNTDFKFNMTATDPDNATFTGWVQFYVNGSATGSVQSTSMNNNTNTFIGTLANANFIKGSELIAEYWAGDGEENSTKANQSTVTVQNSLPTQPSLIEPYNNTYINSINMTWSASTDADSDVINYYVIVNGTQACYTTNLYCSYSPADAFYEWDVTPYDGEDNGTTSLLRYFIYDTSAPTYSNVGKNDTEIKINDVVKFYTQWSDVTNLNYSVFSWNHSGNWVNDSAVSLTGWSNITKTVTALHKPEIQWKIYANDSFGYWNNTGMQSLTIINTEPSQPTLNAPTDGATNQLINTTLNVTMTDVDGDSMNVSFYSLQGGTNYTSQYPPAQSSIYVKATTTHLSNNYPYFATDPAKSLTGTESDNSWLSTSPTNQRFHIDLGSAKTITRVYYENHHHLGADTDRGAENFTFWGSNTGTGTFDDLVWGNDEGWIQLTTNQTTFDQHISSDSADPKYITITNHISYRYYAFKFADNYGDATYIGLRRIELQTGGILLIGNLTNIANGSDATVDWSGLDYNTTYEWYVVIDDGTNTTTSPTWNFTTFAFPLSITDGAYPADDTGFNTLPINFNLTMLALEDFNCTLMINSTENATGDYGSGADVSVSFDETLDDGYWEYYITCEDKVHGTLLNSSINTIFVDTTTPTITLNPSNSFTATNTSTIDNYKSTEFPLNITFADERDLFAMEINITNSTGHTIFNHTNTSLSGLTYTYTETVNNLNWTAGLYNIELIVSDSHTSALIGDYEPIKSIDKLVFNTEEDNLIIIEADDAISSDTIQKYDRYLFEFSYPKEKTTDIVYHVKSNNRIYYRPDSDYNAHFIIWNPSTKSGNWLDFEDITLKDYTVQKINDNHYTVTFKIPVEGIDKIKFNSIGGLNVHTEHYKWFRGSTTQSYTDPILTNISTSFYLDVTNTSSISDIDARFFYNNTEYSVTETTSDDYNFKATITIPAVETGTQTFNFTWNVTVTQTDATHYNFSEINNQTIATANINITIRDELNKSIITETIDVFVVNEGMVYETSTGYILIGNLSAGMPYIEMENDNYPRRGYYITISDNITTHLTAYLLRSSAATQEVIFTIQSSDLEKIEDAKMTFYKMINMSYVTIGQIETDFAGQTALTLDTTNEYRIVIDADGFPIKTLDLRPLQSTYTITLQLTGAGFENVFEGIAYTITPTNRSTNVSQRYTDFRLDIYSSNSDLELFGVRTFGHSYVCIPASCTQNITGSPSGGSAIVRVKGNTTGTVKVDVYYKRTDYEITYLNFNIYSFVDALVAHARSLWESMKTVKADYSPIMLAIIAIVGTIMLLGTAAEIGIYGLPLIVIAAFGLIFFTIIGFIHPLIVGLSLILGGIVYFRFSGGVD